MKTKLRNPFRLIPTLTAIALAGSFTSVAHAAPIYWDGGSLNWNTAANWSTDPANATPEPVSKPGSGDEAVFNRSGNNGIAETVTLGADQAANKLTFSNSGTTTLTGGGTNRILTLGTGGISIANGAGEVIIGSATANQNVAVSLAADQSWINADPDYLTLVNAVSGTNKNLLISGNTQFLATSGLNLGTGVLTMSGGNHYFYNTSATLSGVVLQAGAAYVSGANSLGAGPITIGNTAANSSYTLNVRSFTYDKAISLDSGTFTNNSTIQNVSYQSSVLTGAVSSAGGGAKTLNINSVATGGSGSLTWNTGTINHTGILNLQNTRNTGSGTDGTLTINSVIDSNVTNVNVNNTAGSGIQVVILSGTNAYSGNTTVGTSATLRLSADNVIPDGSGKGNFIVNGTVDMRGNEIVNGLSGSGVITRGTTGTSTLTVGGNDAISSFGGTIQNGSGTLALTKIGMGNLTLTTGNSYTGSTTVKAGTLLLGHASAAGTSNITVGSITAGTLLNNGAHTVANPIQMNANPSSGTNTLGGNTDNTSTFSGAILLAGNASISQVTTTGGNALNLTGGIGSNNTQTQTLTPALARSTFPPIPSPMVPSEPSQLR